MSRFLRRPNFWCVVTLVGAALAVYANSLHGPFVFDDDSSIAGNPTIRRPWPPWAPFLPPTASVTAQGRPLLNFSLALNYAAGGTAVEGYHALNLLIHTLAGLTLFGLVRRTLLLPRWAGRLDSAARPIALAVALWWTVHPLQTESVTYVIQRAESLVGLWYLLTFHAFVRGVAAERGRNWLVLSVAACVAGMATKEVMATAPALVLLFDRMLVAGSFRAAWSRRRGYYLALAGSWVLLAGLIVAGGGNRGGSVGFGVDVAWWDYWLTQFPAIAHYLRLSVWPSPLVFEYGAFWVGGLGDVAGPALVVGGLVGATGWAVWRGHPLGLAGAWFLAILAPTSLMPGTTQMIVEHRMYLPLAAVLLGSALALHRLLGRRAFAGVVALVVVALGLQTARRNADYRTEIGLWQDTVAKRPENPLAHYMLAGARDRAGDSARALASARETLRLKPVFSPGQELLGELLLKTGRRTEAIACFQEALRIKPDFADAHANLGAAWLAEGRPAEAIAHLTKALQLDPAYVEAHYNLGNALAEAGRAREAVPHFREALRLRPGVAEVHYNLANALVDTGDAAAAIPEFETAIRLRPGFARAHYNLGNVLAQSRRLAEAIPQYEAAIRAQPDYADARHNLGSALFEAGRLAEAAEQFEAVLRLAPDFPSARENLARVRRQLRP